MPTPSSLWCVELYSFVWLEGAFADGRLLSSYAQSAAPFDPSNSKQSASDLGDIQPLEEVADVHYADESAGYYSELAVAPRQPVRSTPRTLPVTLVY